MASATAPLTPKQQAFVDGYLLHGNQTRAYIDAGYSPKSAGPNAVRMMENESVQAAIARERSQIKARNLKTSDDLIAEYTKLGFSGMSRFMRINDDGEPVIDLSDCSPADLDLLAEVTIDTYMEGKGKNAREVKKIKIKPYDRYHALDKLAQHLGLFKGDAAPSTDKLASLLKEVMERGSTLPVRVTGPLGSRPPLHIVKKVAAE